MKVEAIAKICHEANRAYCETLGDTSQLPWEVAPTWQKESAMKGVQVKTDNPSITAEGMHESWLEEKVAEGWRAGPVKDALKREHPCLVPYAELPLEQRRKDFLFAAIVGACLAAAETPSPPAAVPAPDPSPASKPATKKGGTMGSKKKSAKKPAKKSKARAKSKKKLK